MSTFWPILLLSVLIALTCRAAADDGPPVEYLTDVLGERLLFHTQGFGNLGLNTCCGVEGRERLPLRVRGTEYARGLGHHANGELVLALEGRYTLFEAEAGVQWERGDTGSVVFQVFVDGDKRHDSGVIREADDPKPIRVPVKGAQLLRLVARDAGDGITCDCADWLNARLTLDPEASAQTSAALDVAPFGTVATWDPVRVHGTAAGRVDEFPAQDIALHTLVCPEADGWYRLPVTGDMGCIGLQWVERRLLRSVALEFAHSDPAPDGARVEYWSGESWWQGRWETLPGKLATDGKRLSLVADWSAAPGGLLRSTQKIRWLIPNPPPDARVCLSAFTRSVWDDTRLVLQAERVLAHETAAVEVYNGALLDRAGRELAWRLARPEELAVRYSRPLPIRSDATVLRFRMPASPTRTATAFAVAVEDVLAHGAVHVPDAGLLVTRADARLTPEQYRRRAAGRRTVLDEVRAAPDQTFRQALAKVHRPIQDLGPMLLSLACDNRKFQANRDGSVQWSLTPDVASHGAVHYPLELRPAFGTGEPVAVTRHLQGGWLPIPVLTMEQGGVRYRQRTFVAPCPATGAPVCIVDFAVENPGPQPTTASVALSFSADRFSGRAADTVQAGATVLLPADGRLLAKIEPDGAPWQVTCAAGKVTHSLHLAAGGHGRLVAYLPTWEMRADDPESLRGGAGLAAGCEAYWHRVLNGAAGLDIPDPLLADTVRASQVHCLIAAREEADGARIAPWISSDRYGPLESEANSIVLGMALLGHEQFARKSLDFFVQRYNPQGYLTTGYTVMGTGWHLWTLGEHWRLTHDEAWLRSAASEVARVCRWIVAQRRKTMRLEGDGSRPPEYGLLPPGVVADWGLYAHRFLGEAHMCAGLRDAARALADIDYPGAVDLLREADDYRDCILAAYAWAQARTPVRLLRDGTWVPACPAMVQCFGKVGEFFPGEDWGRTWAGDVEIGPQHLVALGLMPSDAPDVAWMMDYLEDHWCLQTGMGEYPGAGSEADPFSLGGFAKVQPYYARQPDVHALRDEPKPYIRSYLNAIPSLLSLETLSFWEHFHNTGGWNKTHETGWFLQQTRTLLLTERAEELWLAPFLPREWLREGQTVGVSQAPTHFGEVTYRLSSHVAEGFIEAEIDPPAREAPRALILRVRHPEGKPMRGVMVGGQPHADFDPARECVRLAPAKGRLRVRIVY